ncbi:hypothetical protein, partial [Pseudomonas aeruginosa]|uniref:hypothetical protein n=1 Tax=Pseudomonas aeruginosa TaxID=287 RepID=UPI0019690EA4
EEVGLLSFSFDLINTGARAREPSPWPRKEYPDDSPKNKQPAERFPRRPAVKKSAQETEGLPMPGTAT